MRYLLLLILFAYSAPPPEVWFLDTGAGRGTAFPVECTLRPDGRFDVVFMTAAHVTKGAKFYVIHQGPDTLAGDLKARHPSLDAALLTFVSHHEVEPFPIATEELQLGDPVSCPSYQGSTHHWTTHGYASARDRVTAPVIPGASGAPVLNASGEVVGIVSRGVRMDHRLVPHLVWIVPLADLSGW